MSIPQTGFTCQLLDGRVKTATDFLKLCLRNFCIMYRFRDEKLSPDIPKEIPKDMYHTNELGKAVAKLNELRKLTGAEWSDMLAKAIAKAKADAEESEKERLAAIETLKPFRDAIAKWDCDEEYRSVKEFALSQIDETMPKEPAASKYYMELVKSLEGMTVEQYKKDHIECTEREIQLHTEGKEREEKDCASANKYLSGFWKELEKLEGK